MHIFPVVQSSSSSRHTCHRCCCCRRRCSLRFRTRVSLASLVQSRPPLQGSVDHHVQAISHGSTAQQAEHVKHPSRPVTTVSLPLSLCRNDPDTATLANANRPSSTTPSSLTSRVLQQQQAQSNAAHQQHTLPPPPQHILQNPRATGLIHQHQQHQHRPGSPPARAHNSSIQSNPQPPPPYISPHQSSSGLPQQHQSPYIGTLPGLPSHHPHHPHPGDTTFFAAHPSPYSTHSAAGSYASSEHNESMAAQAAMSRQPYPPIGSYQTPQSNSPASIHSPQHDAHGRPMYPSIPSMPQHMYYHPQYHMQQQSPYAQQQQQHHQQQQQPQPQHHPSMTSAPGMLVSHHQQQQHQPPLSQHQQQQQHQPPPQQHQHAHQSGMIDPKSSASTMQRPPSTLGHAQSPQTPSGPAPGPIPATTPLVVRQDNTGVQWIAFEYSRDRVKMEYTIRCDVESVNVDELSSEFKNANCVYPRACVSKENYKGNRLHYESECNAVGWALAQLNPNLREKRGLIQRAVDSWRNSNQDVRLRSRRVRRMAKIQTRKNTTSIPPGQHLPDPQTMAGALQQPPGMPQPVRQHSMTHGAPGQNPGASGDVSAAHDYNTGPSPNHPSQAPGDLTSPTSSNVRYTHSFYPSYPQQPGISGTTMPPIQRSMDSMHSHSSTLATPVNASVKEEDEEKQRALFGDLPDAKRRKFILVDDTQRGTRVRVRVSLDQVKMDDMPDQHLRINAVYPRSFYPRQMRSPPGSPGGRGQWDDEDDGDEQRQEGVSGVLPTRGKTMVPVSLMDGSEAKLPVPRMTKSRRSKEVALNELGHRMSWGQARTFNGRTIFLQRSLDAYRNKMRSSMIAQGDQQVPAHFETRPGKRKWLERSKRARATTPS